MSSHPPEPPVSRLLEVIENHIAPLTWEGVRRGDKIFGAAILRRSDGSVVVAGTNEETQCPLWHGEVVAIRKFHEMAAAERPSPKECLFLSTHEPCSLCLSAITWSGFDNFHYLFSYEDSRDDLAIPHDLRILEEVFGCADGYYRSTNVYW
jgi:tRNA(Arg) A34 adenosine deaminase TadA